MNSPVTKAFLDGEILMEAIVEVIVTTESSRWMSGIIASDTDSRIGNIDDHNISSTSVFLYHTQAATEDGDDPLQEKKPVGNLLYGHELVNDKLANPELFVDMPSTLAGSQRRHVQNRSKSVLTTIYN